ncbi:hypothetical protein RUND412_007985 [Rhizina undulata]
MADTIDSKRFQGPLTGRPLSFAITFVCTTAFLLFGYDQGVMSGIITAKQFNQAIPETKDNSTMQGFVTAIYEIGCLFGAIFVLVTGERFGRRKIIMSGAAVMVAGVIIQVCAYAGHQSLAQFTIGRIVTGIGNGMNTSSIPTYQAECAKTKNRGLLICIEGGSIAFGTLIAYWLNYGVSFHSTDFVWRFPIAFQCLFCLIIIVGMYFLPESPRWLLSKDRDAEGTAVIAALSGEPADSPKTQLEKRVIMDSMLATGEIGQKPKFRDLLTNGKTQHFRRMLLGSSSQLMQQIGGCNAVIYYFPILFEDSIGQTREMSLIMGGVNMIIYAIFATASWFLIERAGRRKLFLIGTFGQMTSMIITFSCLIPGTTEAAKGAAAGLFLYIASFGATWLPLPWLYPAEINPLRTRGKANAVSTITNWLFNFVIVMITPILIDRIGWGTYVFFAALNASFLPFIYFFYPETKKRSLEEIDFIFAKGHSEGISYVRAAKELPLLSAEEIEEYAVRYGFVDAPAEGARKEGAGGSSEVFVDDSKRE